MSCLQAFKDLGSCAEGRSAFMSALLHGGNSSGGALESESGHEKNGNFHFQNESELRKSPPLLCCWKKLLRSVDSKDSSLAYAIEAVNALSLGSLCFCMDGKR